MNSKSPNELTLVPQGVRKALSPSLVPRPPMIWLILCQIRGDMKGAAGDFVLPADFLLGDKKSNGSGAAHSSLRSPPPSYFFVTRM